METDGVGRRLRGLREGGWVVGCGLVGCWLWVGVFDETLTGGVLLEGIGLQNCRFGRLARSSRGSPIRPSPAGIRSAAFDLSWRQ